MEPSKGAGLNTFRWRGWKPRLWCRFSLKRKTATDAIKRINIFSDAFYPHTPIDPHTNIRVVRP